MYVVMFEVVASVSNNSPKKKRKQIGYS